MIFAAARLIGHPQASGIDEGADEALRQYWLFAGFLQFNTMLHSTILKSTNILYQMNEQEEKTITQRSRSRLFYKQDT